MGRRGDHETGKLLPLSPSFPSRLLYLEPKRSQEGLQVVRILKVKINMLL